MNGHDTQTQRLIAHIVFRFDYGGLENGMANVINGISTGSIRHVVIALTEATSFRDRLRDDVAVFTLGKQPGKDFGAYFRLYKLLRKLNPAIVHTRNIGTLDCALIAWLARVPVRIHGEHGWDVFDPDGTNRKYRIMRKLLLPFVHQIVTVSADLKQWLVSVVGVSSGKVTQICNGVDTERFHPAEPGATAELPHHFRSDSVVIVGSVTRFSAIKDPMNLVEAFVDLSSRTTERQANTRLIMIGDGELLGKARTRLEQAALADHAWLPGSRDDVANLLRAMDVFILGSFREGISNTILEAMASGLPIIATDTGGNRELVEAGTTGMLVPPADSKSLADAIAVYATDRERSVQHGKAARNRAANVFSIATMVGSYRRLYEAALEMEAA